MDRSPRTRGLMTAVSALALAMTAGCTSGSPDTPASSPRSSGTSASTGTGRGFDAATGEVTTVQPALRVETGNRRSRACYEGASRDLASLDYSWHAATDVHVTRVELIDPEGVRLLGTPVTVPPVNYGGRLDLGGELTWKGHERLLAGNRLLSWPLRERLDTADLSAGQSGLFVLHVRRSPGRGVSHGLRVTYTVPHGGGEKTYDAEARDQSSWRVVGPGQRCRLGR